MQHDHRSCARCLADLPCAAASRERAFWAEDTYVMSVADGLDAIAVRGRERRASLPPRFAPIRRDAFDVAHEVDPAEEDARG